MATVIRAEISQRNRYWIDKHRHYELKHFCLQYPNWKKAMCGSYITNSLASYNVGTSSNIPSDPTSRLAITKMYYSERIELIERVAKKTDRYLYNYILKAVTEGLSYTQLKSRLEIPCGRDMYYDRYRRFFWLLSQERN